LATGDGDVQRLLQNNHHHHPQFLRLSHSPDEYDFGFQAARLMKRLGLVKASHAAGGSPRGSS
jgi:fatty-acid desaturase